jgi:DNA polymerase III delta subunit
MLQRAHALLADAEVDGVDRIDVPGRGASEEGDAAPRRGEVERLVPALQSGSLFGGRRGVLVVDAHQLQAAEAAIVAELAAGLDPDSVVLVLVAEGGVPAALNKVVKAEGETHTVRKITERDVFGWVREAGRERRLKVDATAATALVQRFGTDTAAIGQALDQMVGAGTVTTEMVIERFRNRPDEPMWHYADAVAEGDVGQALRRLADFLTHGHPLQLLAFLESDLKRRALARAAPSIEVFAGWLDSSPTHFPVEKAWKNRNKGSEDDLRRALGAIARADVVLKSEPEPIHRVTMERLTVALARWYRGR